MDPSTYRVQRQYSESVLNTCAISFNLLCSTYMLVELRFKILLLRKIA